MRKSFSIPFLILIIAALVFGTQPARRIVAQGGNGGDEATAAGGGGGNGVDTSGNYVAAAPNFAVKVDGFSFENYGNDKPYQNLTPAEVRRMFGDKACASLEGETCILTPSATQWMQQVNKDMGGGHCEGMAVLSLLLYLQKEKPNDFGGDIPFSLTIDSNDKLQHEIAYWWATQAVEPVRSAEIKKTPNEIVDLLTASFKAGGSETYTIGITKRDGSGGHAITPWAIEDRGGGKFWILVYDNNWPGINRAVEVDHEKNTWVYEASTNPNEPADTYEGDAETLSLTLAPTSKRFGTLTCPFCDNTGTADTSHAGLAKLIQNSQQYNQIWLDGAGKLLITDAQGRHYGYVNGKLVKEIPNVRSFTLRGSDLWKNDEPPIFLVPVGMAFTLTVDGTGLKQATTTDVVMIGPGYDLGVEGVKLEPGQQDTLTFSPDGTKLAYKTTSNESPNIVLGLEAKGADYAFDIKGVDLDGGGIINVALDKAKGQLSLNTTGNKTTGTYSLIMDRIDQKGEQTFSHDNITLNPNDTAYLDYAKWSGNKGSVPLGIDHGSKGKISETIDLTDDQ